MKKIILLCIMASVGYSGSLDTYIARGEFENACNYLLIKKQVVILEREEIKNIILENIPLNSSKGIVSIVEKIYKDKDSLLTKKLISLKENDIPFLEKFISIKNKIKFNDEFSTLTEWGLLSQYLYTHQEYHKLTSVLYEYIICSGLEEHLHKRMRVVTFERIVKNSFFYKQIENIVTECNNQLMGLDFAYQLGFYGRNQKAFLIEKSFEKYNEAVTALNEVSQEKSINDIDNNQEPIQKFKLSHGASMAQTIALRKMGISKGIAPLANIISASHGKSVDLGSILPLYEGASKDSIINYSNSFGYVCDIINVRPKKEWSQLKSFIFSQESAKDKSNFSDNFIKSAKIVLQDRQWHLRTVNWLKSFLPNSDRLFVMAAGNDGVVLKKGGYNVCTSNSPLHNPDIRPYAILVGDWDISKYGLSQSSNMAGYFNDIFVVAPGNVNVQYFGCFAFPSVYFYGGTSMAAARVTSLLLLLKEAFPHFTNQEIRQALFKGANRNFAAYDPYLHGNGIANFKGAYECLLRKRNNKVRH